MKISNLRSYMKFLSRNKLYTVVSLFGFAISLMFVILLSTYIKQELSVDDFQKKKDRIYLIGHENGANVANIVADDTKELCPEIEDFVRLFRQPVGYKETPDSREMFADVLCSDSSFFSVFSYRLIEGDPKQVLNREKTAVLTESFANKIYKGKALVGMMLRLNGDDFLITGIMKDIPNNSIIKNPDIVVNNKILEKYWGDATFKGDNMWEFAVFFLVKEGADIHAKIPLLTEKFTEKYWIYRDKHVKEVIFTPLKEAYFKGGIGHILKENSRTQISVYTGIVILILVVALLNYINMTVAQAGSRGKEAAIKKMMGASRFSIVKQMLQESLLMTSFAFLLGLLFAFLAEPFFDGVLNTKLELALQFNFWNISFAIIFVAFISFIAGIIPAMAISNFSPIEVVKGSFARKVKSKYSKILIIFQYVIAIVLLCCSFFIKKQSDFMMSYDMGFNRNGILSMRSVIKSSEREALRSVLTQISGVELVSFSSQTPMDGGSNNTITVDGNQMSFQDFQVDSLFFKVYGITIEPTGVAVTDETYWVNQLGYNALNPDPKTNIADFGWDQKRGIPGITSSFNIRPLHEKEQLVRIRKLKENDWCSRISIKIADNADLIAAKNKIVDEYIKFANISEEVAEAKFVDETIEKWYENEKRMSSIMNAFTVLTIIIMLMGVFAMSVYLIRQKEKEIGLRKINGATEMQILSMLNYDSLIRLLISFFIACPIAYYAMNKWLEAFAYKTSLDWWVFALAGLVVTVLSVISISIQSWRAATANPVESLKSE